MNNSIYIPEPCHESWRAMSPSEKGKFCKVCTKEVVDFTNKSKEDIFEHLAKADGKTCGRFTLNQLDPVAQEAILKNDTRFRFKRIMVSALAFFGLFSLGKKAEAQKMGKVMIKGDVGYNESHNTNTKSSTIFGSVKVNGNNEKAPVTNIKILSGEKLIGESKSIANGQYSFTIQPGLILNKKITLVAECEGYETRTIADVIIEKQRTRIDVHLDYEIMMLGEVAWYEPPVADTAVIEEIAPIMEVDTVVVNEEEVTKICSLNTSVEEKFMIGKVNVIPQLNIEPLVLVETITAIENNNDPVEPENPEGENNNNPEVTENTNGVILPETTNVKEELNGMIFPNPAREKTTIKMETSGNYLVNIFDSAGKLVINDQFYGFGKDINTTRLQRGSYTVKVYLTGQSLQKSFKLVIQ